MRIELTDQQKKAQAAFREFARTNVAPHAGEFDQQESLPAELIKKVAAQGYLGATVPEASGGRQVDSITFGLLNEEIGRACSSLRSLLTVHCMSTHAVYRWGSKHLKERFIPRMASGETVTAFALTEPDVGSDAKSVKTSATLSGDSYILNGSKKWISFGQVADLFLVFAQSEGRPTALVVERDSPGLSITPITGLLGVRASMVAELRFEDCRVPVENLVGRAGVGFSHVASTALDLGRYSVACGCVGIAQACLESCVRYSNERTQFGSPIKDFQLIQAMTTEMIANVKAARLLCYHAGFLRDAGDPRAIIETSIAKYFASRTATKAAGDAVQIHGANGCSNHYPVERYLRDSKIMEIIEGSTQMQQITIARYGSQEILS
ncbi:MAG TPA: acyl-CoA dehydrogenase family protein [Blastocatellia bacterium]|nr:acyl-CoA dehydrogenase family protein [Blastocatellia bacterium]